MFWNEPITAVSEKNFQLSTQFYVKNFNRPVPLKSFKRFYYNSHVMIRNHNDVTFIWLILQLTAQK